MLKINIDEKCQKRRKNIWFDVILVEFLLQTSNDSVYNKTRINHHLRLGGYEGWLEKKP